MNSWNTEFKQNYNKPVTTYAVYIKWLIGYASVGNTNYYN